MKKEVRMQRAQLRKKGSKDQDVRRRGGKEGRGTVINHRDSADAGDEECSCGEVCSVVYSGQAGDERKKSNAGQKTDIYIRL